MYINHSYPAGPTHPRHGQTLTVHAGKVETTFGINDFVQKGIVATQVTKASIQTSRISLAPQRQWHLG